jgi:tubulin polyglutamylase TTLL5
MLWTWAKPQIEFRKLFYFQKVNHFPHNKHISRKDMLKKNIEKIKRLGAKTQVLFDIMPESYLLPGENTLFLERYMHYKEKEGSRNLWIMKPIGMSRGRGISLISSLDQVIFTEPVVLQKYLKNPLLLDGYKFDMRIYVLLTAINPLEVFIYREGFARLST